MVGGGEEPSRAASAPSRLYWTARTAAYLAAEARTPYLEPATLAARRDERVRRLVEHAYATVPFYRGAMDGRGLQPADIRTAADLALLPVIDGRDLAEDPSRFLSTAVSEEPLLELMTSGSSGYAKRILWDRPAVFRARAAGLRHRSVLASLLGRRHGVRIVNVTRSGGTEDVVRAFHAAHSWLPSFLDQAPVQISPEDSFEHAVERINAYRPAVIQGFGAYIGAIYRWGVQRDRYVFAPQVVCYNSEVLPAHDRHLLESVFGIRVISLYQACEALRIGFQCEKNLGLHVSVDQTDVRIADADGSTLPPGARGRVLISNLINRATVLLNYAIGDMGAMAAEPCACGRTLPVLASLDGRADDTIALPGGEIAHESVLLSALYAVPGVSRVQIIQESRERLRVRVVCASGRDWSALRVTLAAVLPTALGTDRLVVDWERVEEIASERSGKFKSIISKVGHGSRGA